jgi:hypothetical protein
VESKNQEEKNLNVRISLMEGDLAQEHQKYRMLEGNMLKFIADCGAVQEQLEDLLEFQRDWIYDKKEYRHPMIV